MNSTLKIRANGENSSTSAAARDIFFSCSRFINQVCTSQLIHSPLMNQKCCVGRNRLKNVFLTIWEHPFDVRHSTRQPAGASR